VIGAGLRRLRPDSKRLGQTEIQHLDDAVVAHHHVGGLEIAMDDAALVRAFEREGDLPGDSEDVVDRHGAAVDEARERTSVDQFHDDRSSVAGRLEAIHLRDVGMVQRRQRLGFAFEAAQAIGIPRDGFGQDLNRDVPVEDRVASPIDLAHTTLTEFAGEFVRPEASAGVQSQVGGEYMSTREFGIRVQRI
jgi:hypothetical protein